VTVFEYPRLERADAKLDYPDYTKLEDRVVQDVRTVSVVEGTKLTLQCFLNKSVASAKLVDAKDAAAEVIKLTAASDEPLRYEAPWTCEQSRRLKLELLDEAGRTNQKTVTFNIHVLPNQPPNVKVVFPAKDLEVSPLEELELKATVWDDFGSAKLGLTYSLAGAPPIDVVISEGVAAKQKHEAAHVVRLEDLHAEPDQLLSYHWWAEDIGPDGQPRRIFGDMYFAEVRPFEEIFRQGEQPPGGEQQQRQQQQQQNQQGQGQNAQDAQQLAKLQKDIISATWKLVLREVADPLTKEFPADAEQIQLSQESALEQAAALAERVQDEKSVEHVEAVLNHMQAAATELKSAAETPSREPLRPALSPLSKRTNRSSSSVPASMKSSASNSSNNKVSRASSSKALPVRSSSGSSCSSSTCRMKRTATRPSAPRRSGSRNRRPSGKDRQVQNRLKELARRQGDVNERLKELQSALEEARTEEQKGRRSAGSSSGCRTSSVRFCRTPTSCNRGWSSLRTPSGMTEQRQQLDETRDQVRRASESLEQERVGQAAASGSRAEAAIRRPAGRIPSSGGQPV